MTAAATSQGFTRRARSAKRSRRLGHLLLPPGSAGAAGRRLRHGGLQNLPSIGSGRRPVKIDVGDNRKADEQRILVWVVVLKLDAHRQSLHHFDEVARGVLWRQQRQRRAGAHRKTGDPAGKYAPPAVHVDIEVHRLADAQIPQLRFLEIGVDPDFVERADRHQTLPGQNIVAGIDIAAGDNTVNFRDDLTIAKVQFSLSEIAFGRFEFRLGLLDGRRPRHQLRQRFGRRRLAGFASRIPPASVSGSDCMNG